VSNIIKQLTIMGTGVAAASAAMEKALRRLDAALASRAVAYRALAEQHGEASLELRQLREALQASKAEADSFRERAALVDALREELGAMQADVAPAEVDAAALNSRDIEIAALKRERDDLSNRLSTALAAQEQLKLVAEKAVARPVAAAADDGAVAALRAELAEARADQAESKAFEASLLARLDATMARLRQALAEPV